MCETPSPEILNKHSEIKQELENIYLQKVKGSAIRSKAEFIENNERSTWEKHWVEKF